MTVGFLSNFINSFSNPISLYYGILTVIMAWLASVFSRKGMFKTIKGWITIAFVYVIIGGAIGSIMTWFLYGGGIGGIGGNLAMYFYHQGCPEFCAQLLADIIIDIPDKLITVAIVCLTLKHYPKFLKDYYPLSYIYCGESYDNNDISNINLKHSINNRIVGIVMIAVSVISIMAVGISSTYHDIQLIEGYEHTAQVASDEVANIVDGDMINDYLKQGEAAPGYFKTKEQLYTVFNSTHNSVYLYVYQVQSDGCHVIFDLDNDDIKGDPVGTIVTDDDCFNDNLDTFLAGEAVDPQYSDGEYGEVMTAFTPIKDSNYRTVGYACVDIDMSTYIVSMMTYVIQVISILFAIALLIFTVVLWYINRQITMPIMTIVNQTNALDKISPDKWLESDEWKNRISVDTGDELEELYRTVYLVEENIAKNVTKVIETEQQLRQSKEIERVNKELAKAIEKADEANKAKTDFLSRMSHDIRTPLNAIIGTINLSKDNINNPQEIKESLEIIDSSSKFLLGLINDILDINKIESGQIELREEPCLISDFSRSIESTIRPLMEKKNITFDFKMNCGLKCIVVDKLRHHQIFFNLLSNAAKYTPSGGHVEYITQRIEAPEGLVGIRNIVRDNGIGMTEEYMEHLFEPFSRDNNIEINQIEGSGLGLAIVKNIVDSMKGTITVHSILGKGTEFIVDLFVPLGQIDDVHRLTQQPDNYLNNKHILLVEDNNLNVKIATKLLEKKGIIVTIANNGQEAVDTFKNHQNYFDAILMDIRMPVLNGLEATKIIRSLDQSDAKNIPIIAMTADTFIEDVDRTKHAGMNAHLSKPISPNDLYQTLSDEINKYRSQQKQE